MKVVVAGGTGLIGRALVERLRGEGHELVVLTRSPGSGSGAREVRWDGRSLDQHWPRELDGADAVVNLAGAGIGGARWTAGRKRAIRASRLGATEALVAAIARAERPPRVLANASGVDYYGDSGDRVVDEDDPPGDTFLARVCREWEDAARSAEGHGVRVVLVRTAFVVARDAPALKLLALPFRLFVGGPLGTGRQWFSWVHLEDVVGLYRLALEREELAGPLVAAAPDPRPQREVAREVARALARPALLPAPTPLLRLALGELADLLLHSHRAWPTRALGSGAAFRYARLDEALAEALR